MSGARPLALITGASSGIGLELARVHAARGGDLVLVARRRDRLESLREELSGAHKASCEVVAIDLAEPHAGMELYEAVESRGLEVDYLINNAGFGGVGRFYERDWSVDRSMIRVNVTALADLTHRFLPGMLERGSGRVMNVASVAGFVPGPHQATYYASKAYVVSFSQAVAEELRGTGVTVTALCPGMTETEFFDVAGMRGSHVMRFGRMSAERVARIGYDGMVKGRRLVVPGLGNKLLVHVGLRLAPRRLATRLSMELLRRRT